MTRPAPHENTALSVPHRHHGLTLAALMVAALGFAFAQTVVAPALPAVQRQFSASLGTATFVLTAFLLTASVATPIAGRLGDIFGKKRVLMGVLGVFAAGSMMAALGDSIAWLIAGRATQGVAAGMMPLAFGVVRDEFPEERLAVGLGVIGAAFGIGGGVGLVLSGLIVDALGLEWIFWFALIAAAAGAGFTQLFVPASPEKHPSRIDWAGAGLLAVGLTALLLALGQAASWGWGSARIVGLLCAAAAVLVVWVVYEHRGPEPLVDMRMLRERTILATNLTSLLTGFGMFGSFLIVPQLVRAPPQAGYGFAASATEAGLYLLPAAATVSISGPLGGHLCGRFGPRAVLVYSTVFAGAAFVLLAASHDQRWAIYTAMALLGFGIGLAFAAMPNLIVGVVGRGQTGVATGVNLVVRLIGGALGGQVTASILASQHIAATSLPTESRFTIAFVTLAAALVLTFLLALAIPHDKAGGTVSSTSRRDSKE